MIKNQCPRSISHGGASLLKFPGRNSIAQFLTKTNFIHFAYFRVVLDLCLTDGLLFGKKTLVIISFEPIHLKHGFEPFLDPKKFQILT